MAPVRPLEEKCFKTPSNWPTTFELELPHPCIRNGRIRNSEPCASYSPQSSGGSLVSRRREAAAGVTSGAAFSAWRPGGLIMQDVTKRDKERAAFTVTHTTYLLQRGSVGRAS